MFILSSAVVLGAASFYVRASVMAMADSELLETAQELAALLRDEGVAALGPEMRREAQAQGEGRIFLLLRSPAGRLVLASNLAPWGGARLVEGLPRPRPRAEGASFETVTLPTRSGRVRVVSVPAAGGATIVAGQTLHFYQRVTRAFGATALVALAIMVLIGTATAFVVARRAMGGVERLASAAAQIGRTNLSERVAVAHESREIQDLGRSFNAMLDRIAELVRELTEVTDNIAHDLRTPIARIRGVAEMLLTQRGGGDPEAAAASIIEDSDRLIALIDTMLEITETESGAVPMRQDPIDLCSVLTEARELYRPLAEERGIRLDLALPSEAVRVRGDLRKVQRAVANLIDNAVKYTPPGGRVELAIRRLGEGVRIDVADTGPGIAPEEHERIFERFYRGDRSRSTPGSGLGLSLARAIARAHGGDLTVASATGQGSVFSLGLPGIERPRELTGS